jgi:alkyldihydroxyacetonephosphate synthase
MTIDLDLQSLLVSVAGTATLDAVETELKARALTLGVQLDASNEALPVSEWLARGAPGAPSAFADPADHLVAGLEARLRDGRLLVVRPGPRRAVGPDLIALVVGTGGQLAAVEQAWLRVHRLDANRPSLPLPGTDLDPPLSDAEARLVQAIGRELS